MAWERDGQVPADEITRTGRRVVDPLLKQWLAAGRRRLGAGGLRRGEDWSSSGNGPVAALRPRRRLIGRGLR